jgi:CDP-glycerol glycerophosphotransferase (TagB/SpsB family)
LSDDRLEQYICEFIDLADSDFRTNSVEIECRLHPAHKPGTLFEEKVNNSYSFNFPTTNAPFENEYLLNYDLLITDYSSILFDYMLLKKPYLLFQPDFEYYMSKNKGFVDDSLVRDLFVHDNSFKCIDSESLITKIKAVDQNSVINNEAILKRAHLYCDDMSSERVFIAICKRLKELGLRRYSGET